MTRRLAKKVLGHPLAYPGGKVALAWTHCRALPLRWSKAARRADRVLRRRYEDDAGRWLAGDGPPPSMYGTVKS